MHRLQAGPALTFTQPACRRTQVVVILFVIMTGGALLGYTLDARMRADVVERLKTPEAGFTYTPGDPHCWLWRLQLDTLQDDLDAPRGTAVVLSEIMGLPFARLRAALPDELLTSSLAAALGRKHAFSRSGMVSVHLRQKSKQRGTRISSFAEEAAANAETVLAAAASETALRLEQMTGTALVLGFLQAATLMPIVELAQHRSAAKRHFAGVATPSGRAFDVLCADFVTMLSPGARGARGTRRFGARLTQLRAWARRRPGNIDIRRRWLPRVRLWKLILSQAADGSWTASSTTAFALEARDVTETANVRPTLLQRLKETFSNVEEEVDEEHGDGAEAVLQSLRGAADKKGMPRMSVVGNAGLEANPGDDPLTCSADAIIAAMPARLAVVKANDPSVDVVRVWTTLCCVSSLQRLNVSWILGDGDTYADRQKTIVDAGRLYVAKLAAEKPALAEALASSAVRLAAKRTTALWKRACDMRVAELRRAEPITSQMAKSHIHRAATEMTRALIVGVRPMAACFTPRARLRSRAACCSTQHSTFSVFLSEPLGGLQRWQSASRPATPDALGILRTDTSPPLAGLISRAVWVIVVTLVIEQVRAIPEAVLCALCMALRPC